VRILRFRLLVTVATVVTVGLGLVVHALGWGWFGKYAGDALYACLVYLLIVLAAPRIRSRTALVAAIGICWAVEFFQLTAWPAELGAHSTLARLILGTTFNAPDLAVYMVGAGLAAAAFHSPHREAFRE
jgi:hypothetical protein